MDDTLRNIWGIPWRAFKGKTFHFDFNMDRLCE